jgi:hypothetical protein
MAQVLHDVMRDGRGGDRLLGDAGRDGGGCVDGGALVLARHGDGGGVIALHLDGDVVGPCPLPLSVGGEQGRTEQQRDDSDGDRPDLPAGHWGRS